MFQIVSLDLSCVMSIHTSTQNSGIYSVKDLDPRWQGKRDGDEGTDRVWHSHRVDTQLGQLTCMHHIYGIYTQMGKIDRDLICFWGLNDTLRKHYPDDIKYNLVYLLPSFSIEWIEWFPLPRVKYGTSIWLL